MLHIVFIPGVIGVPGAPRVLLAPVEALVGVVPVQGDASPAHDDGQAEGLERRRRLAVEDGVHDGREHLGELFRVLGACLVCVSCVMCHVWCVVC